MKPVVIIGIAVGCSVGVVFAVLVGIDAYLLNQREQQIIQSQKESESRLEQMKCEQEASKYLDENKIACQNITGPASNMDDCMNTVEGIAQQMRLQCP